MEFIVKTGVPVPATIRGGVTTKFTPVYQQMEKLTGGQYFEFPIVVDPTLKNPIGNAVYNCRKFARTLKAGTFVVKAISETEVGIWNIDKPVEVKEETPEQPKVEEVLDTTEA